MAQNENISLSLANKVDILNKSQSVDARYGAYDTEEDALDAMALYGLDGRQVAVYSDKVNGKVKLYLYNQVEHKLEPVSNFEDLAPVALSNDYNDLDNKPTIPTVITNHSGLTLDDGTNPHGTTKSDVGLSNVPDLDTTDAVNNEHVQNTDTILDEGGANEITAAAIKTHVEDTDNPHDVTKEQVGLSNVDNTSDIDKPVSIATQTWASETFIEEIFFDYTDTASMVEDQSNQSNQAVCAVYDASDDSNITFPNGETKLQAFYRYNGVATGSIDDYTLISAPSTDGGGLVWLGAWSGAAVSYTVNNLVSYEDDVLICIEEHTSASTIDMTKWSVFISGGVPGPQGPPGLVTVPESPIQGAAFWIGTKAQYDALENPLDEDVIAFIQDSFIIGEFYSVQVTDANEDLWFIIAKYIGGNPSQKESYNEFAVQRKLS